jgi:hypothetical protein
MRAFHHVNFDRDVFDVEMFDIAASEDETWTPRVKQSETWVPAGTAEID